MKVVVYIISGGLKHTTGQGLPIPLRPFGMGGTIGWLE
jgi:hypothetical protein